MRLLNFSEPPNSFKMTNRKVLCTAVPVRRLKVPRKKSDQKLKWSILKGEYFGQRAIASVVNNNHWLYK